MEIRKLTMTEAARGLAAGDWTAAELTDACVKAADANEYNAFVAVMGEQAAAAAAASDDRRARGSVLSPFDGVPIAVKDNILVAGEKMTAGSEILRRYVAAYDATVVKKLKAAGVVIFAKTNMDEFAMGSTTETSCFGPTRNPWDAERVPGGSSGGSAAAVAEGAAIAALGTDTGGSIRQPAAMCGIVGLKPTYGRVSRFGAAAMASSLDQIGPLARSVGDTAALLRIIEGADGLDATVSPAAPADSEEPWVAPKSVAGLKVGLPKEFFAEGVDPEVAALVRSAAETLRSLGAEVKEVSLPHVSHALAVYYIVMPCEVSANLARYDGVRYGERRDADSLEQTYCRTRGRGFGREVRRRIMLGTYALSAGYYDAYYVKALKVRRLITQDFERVFKEVDCLATPTSSSTAWKLGEKQNDPLKMYLADVCTVPVNVVGLPAISLPCGLSRGLPVGLQIIGRHFDERTVLAAAGAYEAARGPFDLPEK